MKKKFILTVFILILLLVLTVCIVKKNSGTSTDSNETPSPAPTSLPTNSPMPITNETIVLFNSNFDAYEGEDMSGIEAKSLISIIKELNDTNPSRTVSMFFGEEEITNSSKIDVTKTYSISFDYDVNGFIYKAIIEEK